MTIGGLFPKDGVNGLELLWEGFTIISVYSRDGGGGSEVAEMGMEQWAKWQGLLGAKGMNRC